MMEDGIHMIQTRITGITLAVNVDYRSRFHPPENAGVVGIRIEKI